jgi:murein DD-endopeptidase MepM/ murein hydrolase activator NlpD
MKYQPNSRYVDLAIHQNVERRRISPHNGAEKNTASPSLQQTLRVRPDGVKPVEYSRRKSIYVPRSKISPQFIAAVLAITAVAGFAYFVLLYQSDETFLRPSADSRAYIEMFNYASGTDAAAAVIAESKNTLPLNTGETFSWQNYTVKKGDSVSKIASLHSLSMDAIIASNDLKNARSLHVGDVLRIPNMDGIPYTVAKGDSYQKIAATFSVPLEAILDANDIQDEKITIGSMLFIPGAKMKSEDLKLAMGELFIYPVNGRLTSTYGWRKDPFTGGGRRFHAAIDLSAAIGTPVKAAMDGKVSAIGFNAVFGRYLIITHSGGYQTMYAHLNSTLVSEGQKVHQGDKVAEVGNTGRSTGAHLHFAVYKNGRAINPLEYLKF